MELTTDQSKKLAGKLDCTWKCGIYENGKLTCRASWESTQWNQCINIYCFFCTAEFTGTQCPHYQSRKKLPKGFDIILELMLIKLEQ